MIKLHIILDPNNAVARSDGQRFSVAPEQWTDFVERVGGNDYIVGGSSMRAAPDGQLFGGKAYVLTRQKQFERAYATVNDLTAALAIFKKYRERNETFWVLGGKQVYELLYPYVDELFVSVAIDKFDADLRMEWDLSSYARKQIKKTSKFTVFQYIKVKK